MALQCRAAIGVIALITAAAVAILLARPTRVPGARRTRDWLAGIACFIAAAALLAVTAPHRAENAHPLPVDPTGSRSIIPIQHAALVPAVEGPDMLEMATLLQVTADRTTLDGRYVDTLP